MDPKPFTREPTAMGGLPWEVWLQITEYAVSRPCDYVSLNRACRVTHSLLGAEAEKIARTVTARVRHRVQRAYVHEASRNRLLLRGILPDREGYVTSNSRRSRAEDVILGPSSGGKLAKLREVLGEVAKPPGKALRMKNLRPFRALVSGDVSLAAVAKLRELLRADVNGSERVARLAKAVVCLLLAPVVVSILASGLIHGTFPRWSFYLLWALCGVFACFDVLYFFLVYVPIGSLYLSLFKGFKGQAHRVSFNWLSRGFGISVLVAGCLWVPYDATGPSSSLPGSGSGLGGVFSGFAGFAVWIVIVPVGAISHSLTIGRNLNGHSFFKSLALFWWLKWIPIALVYWSGQMPVGSPLFRAASLVSLIWFVLLAVLFPSGRLRPTWKSISLRLWMLNGPSLVWMNFAVGIYGVFVVPLILFVATTAFDEKVRKGFLEGFAGWTVLRDAAVALCRRRTKKRANS